MFGMPKEAIKLGGAQRVLALNDLPRTMVDFDFDFDFGRRPEKQA